MYKDELWRYYTKGDATESMDQFLVHPEVIIGIYSGKIDKIGYPVFLFNKLLSRLNGTSELYN